jgi:hypothetical protein
MSAKRHCDCAIPVAVLLLALAGVGGHAAVAFQALDEESAGLLLQVPEKPEELTPRIELAQQRIADLQPTAEPEDEAADAERTEEQALHDAWSAYLAELQRAESVHEELAKLTDEKQIAAAAAEIEGIEKEVQEIRRRSIPPTVRDADLQAVENERKEVEARLGALRERQAGRAASPEEALAARRTPLLERRRELQSQLEQARQAPAEAPTTETPTPAASPQRERLKVEIATVELALHTLSQEGQRDELRSGREQRLQAALKSKMDALDQHLAALRRKHGRSQLEQLEREYAQAEDPVNKALLKLKLFTQRVMLEHLEPLRRDRGRILQAATGLIDRTEKRLSQSTDRWKSTMAGLDHHPTTGLRRLHQSLDDELTIWSGRLKTLRTERDQVEARLSRLETIRQRALTRFAQLADEVTAQAEAQSLDPEKLGAVESAIAEERRRLRDTAEKGLQDITVVVQRFSETLSRTSEHLDDLEAAEQTLYWQRIGSRDSGLLKTDWSAVRADLAAVWEGVFGPPRAPEADDALRLDEVSDASNTREVTSAVTSAVRESVADLTAGQWVLFIVCLAVALLLGIALRYVARRQGVGLASRIAEDWARVRSDEETGALFGVSARVDLLLWNMLGDLIILGLAAAVLAVTVLLAVEDRTARYVLLAAIALIVGTLLLYRLVHHLFEAESPPHRPLPCSDPVARHYRWWLAIFLGYAFLTLWLPTLLTVSGSADALRDALIEVFKTGALVITLLFLLRRRRVLGELSVAKARWASLLALILYPLVYLSLLALLVLQVIGYGALVSFLTFGLLNTALLLLVLVVGAEYVIDAIEHRFALPRDLTFVQGKTPTDRTRNEPRGQHLPGMPSLLRTLIRLAALVVGIAGATWIWNIPLDQTALNWRTVGLVLLTVIVAIVVDRIAAAAFIALHQTGRLPESTTRIFRRWMRGLLAVLVVLSFVAIGGWQIDSIWTFLTTVLAMVAIGFVAVWSILSNLLATLVILVWRPFNVGEEIQLLPEGIAGRVVDINFMYTVLKAEDGSRTSVPNSLFAQKFINRKMVRAKAVRSLAEQLEAEKPLDEK